jgi:hypothetical protein
VAKEDRADPTTPLYFGSEDRMGAPTPVVYSFEDAYAIVFKETQKYGGPYKHPLYLQLAKLHAFNLGRIKYDACFADICPQPSALASKTPTAPPVSGPNAHPAAASTASQNTQNQNQNPPRGASTENEAILGNAKTPEETKEEKAADDEEGSDESKDLKDGNGVKEGEGSIEFGRQEDLAGNKTKKCDEAFAAYLDSVARETNKMAYKNVLKFVFLFRECLNRFGYPTLAAKAGPGVIIPLPPSCLSSPSPAPVPPSPSAAQTDPFVEEYCLVNTAEQAPELSNEFVTVYLEERSQSFDKFSAIDLTQNFCSWLFNHGYTCSKLSLINESS